MKKKNLAIVAAVGVVCAAQTATAQYFTNDLTDATLVAAEFTENSTTNNSLWTYTNDYALAEAPGIPATNEVLQGGAVLQWVEVRDDTSRSYLTTVYSNYLEKSWTAHVAFEAPASGQQFFFMGVGTGMPAAPNWEPQDGENVYLRFRNGHGSFDMEIITDHGKIYPNGDVINAPGADVWMTYNHVNQTLEFKVDHWGDGRFTGVVYTAGANVATYLTDTNTAHIYFGGNYHLTFGEFDVMETSPEVPPGTPGGFYSVISNMQVVLEWDVTSGAAGYNVLRSTDSGSNYVTIADVTTNQYVDMNLETNETYYYVLNATNQFGVSGNSDEVTGVGFPYEFIGPVSSYGYGPLEKDNLFDNDLDTFYDTTIDDSWAGIDFGESNEQTVVQIDYVLRGQNGGPWGPAVENATNAYFEGANTTNFVGGEILHLVPTDVAPWPAVNTATVTVPTAFRYVRLKAPSGTPLFAFGELDFFTGAPVGAEFTLMGPDGSNNVDITWSTIEDYKYTVEASTNLLGTNWVEVVPFTNMVATGTNITVTIPVASFTEDAEVFRVSLSPPDPPQAIFEDDFEGADNWTTTTNGTGATYWELGEPAFTNQDQSVIIATANSPTQCYGTDLNGGVQEGTDVSLTSPQLPIPEGTSAVLTWREAKDMDDWEDNDDLATVTIIDETASSNTVVYTAPVVIAPDWSFQSVPLPASTAGHTIRIEFRYQDLGDLDSGFGGWYIDDVAVWEQ